MIFGYLSVPSKHDTKSNIKVELRQIIIVYNLLA